MSINKRVQRERKSHEDDDVLEESIKLKAKLNLLILLSILV